MVSDSQGRSSLNTRCRLWIVKAAKMHRSAVNYKPRTDQCVLAKDKSLSQKHAYKENRQTEGRSPPEAWLWLLVMRADLWVKCLARGGRFLRSLLETPKGPCVSFLSVLLVPECVTACPCISWEPLFWMEVGKHQSSRSSVPARRSHIPWAQICFIDIPRKAGGQRRSSVTPSQVRW